VDVVRSIVALLLVAFWLPASSHVHLQHLGLIHEIHEDHHHHEGESPNPGQHEHGAKNHAAADGECLLLSGGSGLDLSWCGLTALGGDFDFAPAFARLPAPREASGLAPPGTGPPEIPRSWQFLLRAALPIRAPSLVS
jgi:hypothetical protein